MAEKKSLPELVRDRWKAGDRELAEDRRHYALNEAFYDGNQWVWWNGHQSTVEMLPGPTDEDERVRVTINKFSPRVRGLLGRMNARNLVFDQDPSAADDATLHGARLAARVATATADLGGWESIRSDELLASFLGGTSAVMIEQADDDGDAPDESEDDEAPVAMDQRTDRIRATPGCKLTSLAITEFCLEAGSRDQEASRYFVALQALPPEQVQAYYEMKAKPAADASGASSPMARRLTAAASSAREPDLTCVYTMYERPNHLCPAGRHVVIVGEEAVIDRPWPFKRRDRLNLEVFHQAGRRGKWYGKTFLNEARPVQVAYNMIRSNIHEHARKAGNARLMVPMSSVESMDDFDDDPGALIPYFPEHGKPEYLAPPQIARWLTQEPQQLEAELDDIMHSHAVTRGALNLDRQSGVAVSILAEKNDTPLGLMARQQADGWSEIASFVLEMFEDSGLTRAVVVELAEGIKVTEQWTGNELRGQTRVRVPLESTLPQSRSAMQAMLGQVQQQFPKVFEGVDASVMARLLDLPNQRMLSQAVSMDAQRAVLENALLAAGQVVIPQTWHDHARHIAEHNRHRNTQDFELADPDVQLLFAQHLAAHEQLVAEEAAVAAAANEEAPGLAALPQANNPIGSAVPPPMAEIMSLMNQQGA